MERFSQAGNVRSYFPRNFSVMLSEGMSLTPGCLGQENQFCWKRTFVLSKIPLLLSSESQAFQDGNRWCKVTLELAGLTDRQTSFHPSLPALIATAWLPAPQPGPSESSWRAEMLLSEYVCVVLSFWSSFLMCQSSKMFSRALLFS